VTEIHSEFMARSSIYHILVRAEECELSTDDSVRPEDYIIRRAVSRVLVGESKDLIHSLTKRDFLCYLQLDACLPG
jgi:hypothetical protein